MDSKLSKSSSRKIITNLYDVVEIEDKRIQKGESQFLDLEPLRSFRGNYGVPRIRGDEVVKGYFSSTESELNLLEKLHNDYVQELKKNVPVVKTQIIRDENLMYLVQPHLQGYTFEDMLQNNFTTEQKSQAFQEILTQALTVVSSSDKIVGIDGKPENWMYEDNKWTVLDTFPPFLVDGDNIFAQIFNLRRFEKEFAENPDKTYFRDSSKIIRRLWLKSENFDSNLDYQKLALDTVKEIGLPNKIYRVVQKLK